MGTRVEWGQVPWWRERKDVEADLILHKAVSWQEAVSPENRISGGILIPNHSYPKATKTGRDSFKGQLLVSSSVSAESPGHVQRLLSGLWDST